MIKADKIIVCCTGNGVTGGPELLHQLVHQLRKLGHDAYVAYYPFECRFECPEAYRHYDAPQAPFSDAPGNFIVVPETATRLLKEIRQAQAAVWWLSVDNYFGALHQSRLMDLVVRYKTLVRRRLPLRSMRSFLHFAQSRYAEHFLQQAGISSFPLTDYLGEAHLQMRETGAPRRNIVVYNPKKGAEQTSRLREANPDLEFVPIQNMTSRQVAELLASAKIYIDFGQHAGKDRPPREAAIAGCCVITGRRGSARFSEDVPVPELFKLDDSNDRFIRSFRPLVDAIFEDYASYAARFEPYREKIRKEPLVFSQQVEALFGRAGS